MLRSLVCDSNGLVIAQTVYRCMICADILDSLEDIQKHYRLEHYEDKINATKPGGFIDRVEGIDYEDDNFNINDKISKHVQPVDQSLRYYDQASNGEEENNSTFNYEDNDNSISKLSNLSNTINIKGGYVTCEVCGLTKFYSHISRRYGVFSCESCAKFFFRYCKKPTKLYCAHNNNCQLDIDLPGARCKSCLLEACFKKYILDPKKHPKIFGNNSLTNENIGGDSDDEQTYENEQLPRHSINTSSRVVNPKPTVRASKTSHQSSPSTQTKSASQSPLHFEDKESIPSPKQRDSHKSLPLAFSSKRRKHETTNDTADSGKHRRGGGCHQCAGCLAKDCGKCLYCLDKPKFGGNDIKKQKCIKRRCHLSSQ